MCAESIRRNVPPKQKKGTLTISKEVPIGNPPNKMQKPGMKKLCHQLVPGDPPWNMVALSLIWASVYVPTSFFQIH
jgi:hypothetical protein